MNRSASPWTPRQLPKVLPLSNPLELGAWYRDRARVAIAAGDRASFDAHLTAMDASFRATRNPCLIAQVDALLAAAVRAGLRSEVRPTPSALPPPLSDTLSEMQTFVESVPPRREQG